MLGFPGPAWFAIKNLPCQRFGKPKLGKKSCHGFGKPNVRGWQVLVANQIIAKIMAYRIFGLANLKFLDWRCMGAFMKKMSVFFDRLHNLVSICLYNLLTIYMPLRHSLPVTELIRTMSVFF